MATDLIGRVIPLETAASKPSQRQSLLSYYHSVRLIFPAFQLQFDRQTVHLFLLQAAHHVSGFGKCRQ